MKGNESILPIVKWAGGKRRLVETFKPLLPKEIASYCEPFLGGGAVLFHLQPSVAYVNDINSELICTYTTIRDSVDELLEELKQYRNDKAFFYAIRKLDRSPEKYAVLTDVQKAARMLYLNKTCYNGLYRVNSAGEFNAPFGYYKNPDFINESALRAASKYFNSATIHFSSVDYSEVLRNVEKETFVYLDPPYDPISKTSNFTEYSKGGFSRKEQIRLRECCDELDRRGVKFMVSNSATDFILEQYLHYNITTIQTRRLINPIASGAVKEVVIRNYE